MDEAMNEPLGLLFEQFVKERRYLEAVSPNTVTWYFTAPSAGLHSTRIRRRRFVARVPDWREQELRGRKPRAALRVGSEPSAGWYLASYSRDLRPTSGMFYPKNIWPQFLHSL